MTIAAIPERLGPYDIIRVLGHGGMGTVYLATQAHPMERRVALKVLREGLESPRALARFEVEREALALMSHPNIAHVFDAGVTERGRPWVAMEYVQGEPINDYCTRMGLDLEARLQLMIDVCAAIAHAHQKGMIHRDLKPSNVLVTVVDGQPVVKVIDFGLARRVDGSALTQDARTEGGMLIGTPAYMSPEQAAGRPEDVDTRTDVHGLGVLLYELVTGEVPHGPPASEQVPFFEVLDQVLREDPLPPSARVSTHDASTLGQLLGRSFDVSVLRRRLRGDLDRVVLKALEKDRDQRYATVGDLAADLRRFLAHEPVLAAPPGAAYRLRKFVRRHRTPVVAAVAILVALAAGLVTSLVLYGEAADARDVAETALANEQVARKDARGARDDAEDLVTFMLVDLRDGLEALGRLDLLGDVAQRARTYYEARAAGSLATDELTGYALAFQNVGEVLRAQGALDLALASYRSSADVCERAREREPDNALARALLAKSYSRTGQLLKEKGDLEGAAGATRRSLDLSAALVAMHPDLVEWQDERAGNLNQLGDLLRRTGDLDGALAHYREGLAIREAVSAKHPDALKWQLKLSNSANRIAQALREKGALTEALDVHDRVLRIRHELVAAVPDNTRWLSSLASGLSFSGQTRKELGDLEGALSDFRESQDIRERLVALDPSNAIWLGDRVAPFQSIGDVLREMGDAPGALDSFRAGVVAAEQALDSMPGNVDFEINLYQMLVRIAGIQAERGELADAREILLRCLSYWRGRVVAGQGEWYVDQQLGLVLQLLADTLRRLNDIPGALVRNQEAHETFERLTLAFPDDLLSLTNLSAVLTTMKALLASQATSREQWGQFEERAGDALERIDRHPRPTPTLEFVALGLRQDRAYAVYLRTGDVGRLVTTYRETLRAREELSELTGVVAWRADTAVDHAWLAALLTDSGEHTESLVHGRRAIEIARGLVVEAPANLHWLGQLETHLSVMALIQRSASDNGGALESVREQVQILERLVASVPERTQFAQRLAAAKASAQQLELEAGVRAPATVQEHLEAAHAALAESRFEAAVGHFEAALADPGVRSDIERGNLYAAARAAARAAAEAEDESQRDRLTQQAIRWLEADLALGASLIERVTSRKARRKLKRHIDRHREHARREEPDFAGLRGSSAFEALFETSTEAAEAPKVAATADDK